MGDVLYGFVAGLLIGGAVVGLAAVLAARGGARWLRNC